MARIAIETAYRPIEVDLWGSLFETVDQTKGNQKQIATCQTEMAVLDEDDADSAIALFGKMFDLMFKPLDGGKKKASTALRAKWNEGDLGFGQISNFLTEVNVAQRKSLEQGLEDILSNGRPT